MMPKDAEQVADATGPGRFEVDRLEFSRMERLGAMGTVHWDLERDEIRLSDGAREILGISGEPRTNTFEEITSIVELGEPERIDEVIHSLREGGPPVQLRTHLTTPAGERKELESRLEAVGGTDGAPRELRGIIQDVTERRRAEREREAVHAVTRALAESVSIGEAIERVLGALAETTDWQAASFWSVDEEARTLRCERTWFAAALEEQLASFADAAGSLELERGRGVPGIAWDERRTVWRDVTPEDDVRQFPRRELAERAGLSGILAFPLLGGEEVIGVIDLWRRQPGKPPDDLVELVGSFGRQIGQFIERTRAEAKLQESRTLTASVVDAALECVITIDAMGRVVDWNPASERTFGYRRADVLGKEIAELIIPERHRVRHRQGLGRVRDGGEGRFLGRRVEIEAIRASGEEFPVELTVNRIGADPPTYTGWVRDITERRRSDEALRESRQLLAETQRLAQIGSWEWDPGSDEVRATDEARRLLGLDPDERPVTPGNLLARVHPDHRDGLREAIEQCATAGRTLEYLRTPLERGEDGLRVVEWFAAPVERGEDARAVHGTVQNVTPEAELEAELATRARQQAAVARLGSEALVATDVDAVIASAIATVAETLEVEHCAVMELLESGEGLLLRAGVGWEDGIVGSFVAPPGTGSQVPKELLDHGLASAAAVLIAGDAGPIGSLGAYSPQPRRFSDDDVTFLQGIANVLAATFAAERESASRGRLRDAGS